MKEKISNKKVIIIAAAVVLVIFAVVGTLTAVNHSKKEDTTTESGVKHATAATLKELKEEAEKVSKASKVFFTLDDYDKYEYPTGKVITVEVNSYGKLVVLANDFSTDALNDLIEYSGVNVGADIGLTDVVYSIRFDKNNEIETAEGKEDDPDSILYATTETTTKKITIDMADEKAYEGYATEVVSLLKSCVSSYKATLTGTEVSVYTDEDGYLRMNFTGMGFTQDQYDEFVRDVENAVPLNKFVGYSYNYFKIEVDNNNYKLEKINVNDEEK